MYFYSNSTVSTTFTIPNGVKDNENFINKNNQYLEEEVKESNAQYKIIKISKNNLDEILQKEVAVKISCKSCFQENNLSKSEREKIFNSKREWTDLPQEVRDEVLKLIKQRKLRKCENNCPCKFTHELIQLYHDAQLIREKLETVKNHQLKISNSDDCCQDDSMHTALITERNKNCNLKELKNNCVKISEKLKIHSEANSKNQKYLKGLKESWQQIYEILEHFRPRGKIFQLKKEQQAIDSAFLNRAIFLEEDDLYKAKEKIQMRMKRKEEWAKKDKIYDMERDKERRMDTFLALKSTNLMNNYIEELKHKIMS